MAAGCCCRSWPGRSSLLGRADRERTYPVPRRQPVSGYHDHVLPLRPGTADLPIDELLAAQCYLLTDWRSAAAELNWRRFLDISSLIAIKVEEPDVFAASHGVLLGLVAEGLIDGLRIDHPDGLADPRGYLSQLATATDRCWTVSRRCSVLARCCQRTGSAQVLPATTRWQLSVSCSPIRPARTGSTRSTSASAAAPATLPRRHGRPGARWPATSSTRRSPG